MTSLHPFYLPLFLLSYISLGPWPIEWYSVDSGEMFLTHFTDPQANLPWEYPTDTSRKYTLLIFPHST